MYHAKSDIIIAIISFVIVIKKNSTMKLSSELSEYQNSDC